jgi:hypothetical protein
MTGSRAFSAKGSWGNSTGVLVEIVLVIFSSFL